MKKIVFFVLLASGISCSALAQSSNNDLNSGSAITLTSSNFDSLTKKGIVLVDFWASWCIPCLNQSPIIDNVAKEMAGKVLVGKVDVDKWSKLSSRFGIEYIPALLIFKNGKVMEKLVGLQSKVQIIERLNFYLN